MKKKNIRIMENLTQKKQKRIIALKGKITKAIIFNLIEEEIQIIF